MSTRRPSSTRLTPSSSCRTSESHKKQIRYVKVLYYITGAIAFVNKITSADLWSPVEKNVDLIKVGRDASPRGCVCPHLMTKSPLLTTPTISLTHNCTRMLHARLQRRWWKRKMGVVWCGSLDSKGNPGNFSTKGDGGSHMLRLDDINTYQQSTFCRSDSNSTLNNCVRQSVFDHLGPLSTN